MHLPVSRLQCPAQERALDYTGAEAGMVAVKGKAKDLELFLDTTLSFPPHNPCMSQASFSEKEEIDGS